VTELVLTSLLSPFIHLAEYSVLVETPSSFTTRFMLGYLHYLLYILELEKEISMSLCIKRSVSWQGKDGEVGILLGRAVMS
jgi:hypothetical protein